MARITGLLVLRLWALVAFGLAGIAAAPAQAKDDARGFAACLVMADPSRVDSWVVYDGPGLIYKEVDLVSRSTNCRSSGKFEYWTFRGLLAEELLAPVLMSGIIPDLSKVEPPTDVVMAQRWGNNDGRISMLLNVFAECKARTDPASVVALLRSRPGSDEERQISDILERKDDPCRQQSEGVALKLSASIVRARAALGLYQLTRSAGDTAVPAHS